MIYTYRVASIPSITVDTKLQPFCMHIICKRLDARGECFLVWNQITLKIVIQDCQNRWYKNIIMVP